MSRFLHAILLRKEGKAYNIEEEKKILRDLYMRLGELDAFQAVAYIRKQMNPVCEPEFTDNRCLEAAEISHPGLANAVVNTPGMIEFE